ncbi:uncharacterized protein KY384_004489 [Bacidia gigantensis]|uniref:uncharacterized protein n=1 Tax=Bacidia gigantensis TaxID=2732470 RepID=UPI001D03B617|nr:uncharacterized protein KY384_004489 [Bacidia gigantensis]KAG8531131.1 hypothetical protein KY384_004489 [Bacidia gigantensis]
MTDDRTMFGTICGGPISGFERIKTRNWFCDCVLLTGKRNHNGILSDIRYVDAENLGGTNFFIHSTSEAVVACNPNVWSPFVKDKPPLYFPSHVKCMVIAEEVIASHDSSERGQRSLMRHLWQVLEARWKQLDPLGRAPHKLHVSSGYYGAYKFQEMDWTPENGKEGEAKLFESNPVEIPSLNRAVLSHLNPLLSANPSSNDDPDEPTIKGLSQAISSLPPEIIANITDQVTPLNNPSLTPNYILEPSYWHASLFSGTLLPYLWDISETEISEEDGTAVGFDKTADGWDWELLAEQLAQTSIHERGKVFHIPLGLRNRRRIWRLVEDILGTEL